MSEPLVTRQTLRRDIAKTARMRFPLRYPDGSLSFTQGGDSNSGTNSTEVFYCTSLKQSEGFWNSAYIYVVSTDADRNGFERMVPNFNADQSALFLEWPCTTDQVPTSDDSFELLDVWPPHQIHDFVNDALRDSWRTFPEITEDETLVIEEDKIRYDLTGLSEQPAYMLKIFMERSQSAMLGQISTVTDSDTFGDTSMDLSDIANGTLQGRVTTVSGVEFGDTSLDLSSVTTASDWSVHVYDGTDEDSEYALVSVDTTTQLMTVSAFNTTPDTDSFIRVWNENTVISSDWAASIYKGTGAGQLFEIQSADTTTQTYTVATPSTRTPDTTSKIRVWNKNREERNWYPLLAARMDRMEFPSYFDIIGDPFAYYGYRLRLSYVREPVEMTADSDETTVPQYFIKNKALAFMHDALVGDNRASRTDHVAIAEHYDTLARDFALRNPRRLPAGTIWEVEGETGSGGGYGDDVNPLNW